MSMYWVSFILQTSEKEKVSMCALNDAYTTLEQAINVITKTRQNADVLSAWVDIFENDKKITVFHTCYVDIFGKIKKT